MQHKSLLLSVSKKVIGVKIELCGNAQHKYASQSIGCGHYTTVHTIMQEEIAENNSKTQGYPIEERAEIGIYLTVTTQVCHSERSRVKRGEVEESTHLQ